MFRRVALVPRISTSATPSTRTSIVHFSRSPEARRLISARRCVVCGQSPTPDGQHGCRKQNTLAHLSPSLRLHKHFARHLPESWSALIQQTK